MLTHTKRYRANLTINLQKHAKIGRNLWRKDALGSEAKADRGGKCPICFFDFT